MEPEPEIYKWKFAWEDLDGKEHFDDVEAETIFEAKDQIRAKPRFNGILWSRMICRVFK